MSPVLELKSHQRRRRKGEGSTSESSDTWAPPDVSLKPGGRRIKKMRPSGGGERGPAFRSSSQVDGQLVSKARKRLAPSRKTPSDLDAITSPGKARASTLFETSPPTPLDYAAADVKRLATGGDLSDAAFIRVARSLRDALKSEFYSDPQMADVCLVLADALTFTLPDELRPGALDALSEGLMALAKPRGEHDDPRRLFAYLIETGWRVTPTYDEGEFAVWAQAVDGTS